MGILQLNTQKIQNYSTKGRFTPEGCFRDVNPSLLASQGCPGVGNPAPVGSGRRPPTQEKSNPHQATVCHLPRTRANDELLQHRDLLSQGPLEVRITLCFGRAITDNPISSQFIEKYVP